MAVLKTDGKTLETGTWSTASSGGQGSSLQSQKIVTFHVSENGDTLVQEAFETATGTVEQEEAADVSQIGIETYETTDFSVVEQSEEIPAPGAPHRYCYVLEVFFELSWCR